LMVLALAGDSTITSDLAIRLYVPSGTILLENRAPANRCRRSPGEFPS
jgi:hypothetical protein